MATSDDKVIKLAQDWIERCEKKHPACGKLPSSFYPSRLIDVSPDGTHNNFHGHVRIVSSKSTEVRDTPQPDFTGRYITLSHRWGTTAFNRLRLNLLQQYQDALHLDELPLTFQHVIILARKLAVRWIWIDALCIIQDSKQDWLQESAVMHKIYAHSYCNISATASLDSSGGLFRSRNCRRDWIQDVTVKVKDLLPGGEDWISCTVVDLSFWERLVTHAPVNMRSWVLQERLLAPRVLHWCKDQIAFECRSVSLAECYPHAVPHMSILQGELVEELFFKQIEPSVGQQLRRVRLQKEYPTMRREKLAEMVDGVGPRWHYYEIWKRIVESYSKLELYKAEDRLIALSGVARTMGKLMDAQQIPDRYVAGLWKEGLPCLLLWYVNESDTGEPQPLEDNRPKDRDGQLLGYRAPTFSWASVETRRGISFAELTANTAKVSVDVVRLVYLTTDKFGLLTDGYILLKGILRRIVLVDKSSKPDPPATKQVAANHDKLSSVAYDEENNDKDNHSKNASAQHTSYWHSRNHIWSLSAILTLLLPLLHTIYQLLHKAQLTQPPASDTSVPTNINTNSQTTGPNPPLAQPNQQSAATTTPRTTSRYSWRLTKDGLPHGSEYSTIYLDSPASQPSIFGAHGNIFIIPILLTQSSLSCLMVQATSGDYGIRYKRVGLTVIRAVHGHAINDILTPPTRNENERGKYYWGPEGQRSGETDICII